MHSLLIKLLILCLASRQLEATGGEGGSSHPHDVKNQGNSPAENEEQSHHHAAQHQKDSPGTMIFTLISERLEKSKFEGAIIDFGTEQGKCKEELLGNDEDGNPRFSVDWANCGVKGFRELLRIRIHPKFKDVDNYHAETIIQLNVPYEDLKHYFKGGEATIELPVNGSPIVRLKDSESARPNPASNRSKNPHLATFIVKHEDDFVFHRVGEIRLAHAYKPCESENLPDKSGFTVDWAKCGLTKASELAQIEIYLKFLLGSMEVGKFLKFEKVRPDVLEHSFNGGKAIILVPSDGMNDHPIVSAIKEEENLAPKQPKSPHLTTFIVQMQPEDAADFVFDHVAGILWTLTPGEAYKPCKSEMLPDKQGFTVDWAKCGLTKTSDLEQTEIRLKFRLGSGMVGNSLKFEDVRPDMLEHSFNGGKVKVVFSFKGKKPILSAMEESDAPESSGHHGHGHESPKPHIESPPAI